MMNNSSGHKKDCVCLPVCARDGCVYVRPITCVFGDEMVVSISDIKTTSILHHTSFFPSGLD